MAEFDPIAEGGRPVNGAEPRVRVKEKATGKVGSLPQSQVAAALKTGKYEKI